MTSFCGRRDDSVSMVCPYRVDYLKEKGADRKRKQYEGHHRTTSAICFLILDSLVHVVCLSYQCGVDVAELKQWGLLGRVIIYKLCLCQC